MFIPFYFIMYLVQFFFAIKLTRTKNERCLDADLVAYCFGLEFSLLDVGIYV